MSDVQNPIYIQLFEEISKGMDKLEGRFDKSDARFDKLTDMMSDVNTRLTRIEASDVAARMTALETEVHKTNTRMTKLETLMLPATGLGSALLAAGATWLFTFLPGGGGN